MPSFDNIKDLKFVITLGTTSFNEQGDNQITLRGFRAVADITKAGGVQMGTLRAQIFGVAQSDMNTITTLQWKDGTLKKNTIVVYAIDGDAETLVFAGNIVNAFGVYQNLPDVYLSIQAQAAFFGNIIVGTPTSVSGPVKVSTLMKSIASDLGLTFSDGGVDTVITDPYLPFSALEKAKILQQMCGFEMFVDDMTLAITPRNTARDSLIPDISADSGLVGYPTFDGYGVNFQTLFNPSITFGGKIKLSVPDIPIANGEWFVQSISHRLESYKPGGGWFSEIRGTLGGLVIAK
jgi:hypothetical protein